MAAPATHQTMRLSAGRHRSPDQGACVIELASMLAGEKFSDHPDCVDPVVAAFLRTFNDRLSARDRQRLLPYASLAVNTRGNRAATRARRRACFAFAGSGRAKLALYAGFGLALRPNEGPGVWAARQVFARHDVAAGFAFLDQLLGRDPGVPAAEAVTPAGSEPAALAAPVAGLT